MAAAVVIGFLKMRSHWLNTRLLVISERAALVALGHEGEEHLGLVGGLLDVPDVVEDEHVVGSRWRRARGSVRSRRAASSSGRAR